MKRNEKYSFQSWKRVSFVNSDESDFNDTEIVGACFYQDTPNTEVFPKECKGIVFTNCNLDNVVLPVGSVLNGGTNKQFKEQNDGEYWIVDSELRPIEPREKDVFLSRGLSVDPKSLPQEKAEKPVLMDSIAAECK